MYAFERTGSSGCKPRTLVAASYQADKTHSKDGMQMFQMMNNFMFGFMRFMVWVRTNCRWMEFYFRNQMQASILQMFGAPPVYFFPNQMRLEQSSSQGPGYVHAGLLHDSKEVWVVGGPSHVPDLTARLPAHSTSQVSTSQKFHVKIVIYKFSHESFQNHSNFMKTCPFMIKKKLSLWNASHPSEL